MLGKMHRLPFTTGRLRATEIGELKHIPLVGLEETKHWLLFNKISLSSVKNLNFGDATKTIIVYYQ